MCRRQVNPLMSALVALFLTLGSVVPSSLGTPIQAAELFAREPLTIRRQRTTPVILNVELALTQAQREQGLMFRRTMGENEGMLFDFGDSRQVYMWMKNTVLPLDMLFIDDKGQIAHIKQNAEPFSEAIIPSVHPVRYVLELLAGTADRLHLQDGDQIESRQLGNGG